MGNNKNLKRLLIALIGLLVVIVGAVAFVFVSGKMKENNYEEAIASAEKFVTQSNFEDAIVEYQKAISVNPEEDEAYLGLAELYLSISDVSKAKAILNKGLAKTKSAQIEITLARIESGSLINEKMENTDIDLTKASDGIKLDTAVLQKMVNYAFVDFKDEFGRVSSITKNEDGFLEVVHSKFNGICYYRNTSDNKNIVDNSKKEPKESGMPEKIMLSSLGILFRNFDGAVSLDKLQILLSQRVQPKTKDGRTYIEAILENCTLRIETDESGNIVSDAAWNEIVLTNANKGEQKAGRMTGVVLNAVTGDGVPGASLTFEPMNGKGTRNATLANNNGVFSIDLKPGKYEISVQAEGFITDEFTCEIEDGKTYSGEQFVISPELATGTARIVLEWNSQPHDLDSYLTGRTDSGYNVDVNYGSMTSTGGGNTLATLDVDDTDGYGPETTTIHDLNGVFKFTVKDFLRTGTMSQYGATVKIYLPGQEPVTITLDTGAGIVDVWDVCEMDHGQLKILNESGD